MLFLLLLFIKNKKINEEKICMKLNNELKIINLLKRHLKNYNK